MGDRGNVVVKDGDEQVVFYTHWGATELPETLRMVLNRKQRWTDAPYLARMIFCGMVGEDWDNETGFGISHSLGDGTDRVITVDVNQQTVKINKKSSISFNEFCKNEIGW